ncbi:carboxypeptidase regulatory-like domain-containing protein [Chondromyces crocatus]|uniref:carboxypeptidase regulatory-like domain-containing protein n=1 Tax=Chondromyces crocatus TaxID=52 RepID=UPI0012E17FDE|nr:carboxypeptidase regulatory-like domain-containing protein [Chondromyces crocatus]
MYDGAERLIQLEVAGTSLSPVTLRFTPAVEEIDLDREQTPIVVALHIERRQPPHFEQSALEQREGLVVHLEDEAGKRLGEAITSGDGRARFDLRTAALPGPGQGELRASFPGTEALVRAVVTQRILRYAQASLSLAHPIEAADAEEGVAIDVSASSSRGPVDGGLIEALRGSEIVGTAMVHNGHARLLAVFSPGPDTTASLSLRYVPSAPWWRAGAPLQVEAPVREPGIVRQICIGALVLAVASWILGGWRRAPKPAEATRNATTPLVPTGRAGVKVVNSEGRTRGWRGVITDAHDGACIAGATIIIVAPTFEGDGVVARASSDQFGAFSLDAEPRQDARLIVDAPHHSTYTQALPSPSTLAISLVTRRRTLLDNLIHWARRRGAPFETSPEPTPGHVRRAANRSKDPDVERWAGWVEEAAFGPKVVDEHLENEIRSAEPGFVAERSKD